MANLKNNNTSLSLVFEKLILIFSDLENPLAPCRSNSSFPMESVEEESCKCQQFQSVPGGQWSQCILESSTTSTATTSPSTTSSSSSQFCGIGKRFRRLDCLDSNNQITDPK